MHVGLDIVQPSQSRGRRKLPATLGITVLLLQLLTPWLHTIAERSASGDLTAVRLASGGGAESFAQSESSAATPGAASHDPSQCVICKNLAQLRANLVPVVAAFIGAPAPQTIAMPRATQTVASLGLDESSPPRGPPPPITA